MNNELLIEKKYYNTLDIESFAQMMKDPSACYKYFWLEAIVKLISKNVYQTTYECVVDEMIVNAWYIVLEHHIHLSGINADGSITDALERSVLRLAEISGLEANASSEKILRALDEYRGEDANKNNTNSKVDKILKEYKNQLTKNVPYCALSGFFDKNGMKADTTISRFKIYSEKLNEMGIVLPYSIGSTNALKREIVFNEEWVNMIQDNTVSILGWIQFEKMRWLQKNNPEVPGLVYKLSSSDDKKRKLDKVRNLWDAILLFRNVNDVFTDEIIDKEEYDLEHFIPWSFVMNDELWNLMPMDASLNSSKSNKLPKWDVFFSKYANNQFALYCDIHSKDKIHALFDKCFEDNLHSIWASQELYKPGNTEEQFFNILEKNMRPVYDSARRQGYEIW